MTRGDQLLRIGVGQHYRQQIVQESSPLSTSSSIDEFVNYEVEYVENNDTIQNNDYFWRKLFCCCCIRSTASHQNHINKDNNNRKRNNVFMMMTSKRNVFNLVMIIMNVIAMIGTTVLLLYFIGPLGPNGFKNAVEFAIVPDTRIASTKVIRWDQGWNDFIFNGLHLKYDHYFDSNNNNNNKKNNNNDEKRVLNTQATPITTISIAVLSQRPIIDYNNTVKIAYQKHDFKQLTSNRNLEYWNFVANPYSMISLTSYYEDQPFHYDGFKPSGNFIRMGLIISERDFMSWMNNPGDESHFLYAAKLTPNDKQLFQFDFQPHHPRNQTTNISNNITRVPITIDAQQVVYFVFYYNGFYEQRVSVTGRSPIRSGYVIFDSSITNYAPVSRPLTSCLIRDASEECYFDKEVMNLNPYFLISATTQSPDLQIISVKYHFISNFKTVIPISLSPILLSISLSILFIIAFVHYKRKQRQKMSQHPPLLQTNNNSISSTSDDAATSDNIQKNYFTNGGLVPINESGNNHGQLLQAPVIYHRALFYGSDFDEDTTTSVTVD